MNVLSIVFIVCLDLSVATTDETSLLQTKSEINKHGAGALSYEEATASVYEQPSIVLSWNPRIIAFPNFVSEEEIDELKQKTYGVGYQKTSLVGATGNYFHEDRYGDIGSLQDIDHLRRRIADVSRLPVENQETTRVMKYGPGQFFRGHIDSHALADKATTSRTATFYIYLSDSKDDEGGETVFPLAVPNKGIEAHEFVKVGVPESCASIASKDPFRQADDLLHGYIDGFDLLEERGAKMSPPLKERGIAIKPRKGMAILWQNRRPDGQVDPQSQHAGCPGSGEKLSLTTWIHFMPPDWDRFLEAERSQALVQTGKYLSLLPLGYAEAHKHGEVNTRQSGDLNNWQPCPAWNNSTCSLSLHRTGVKVGLADI